MGPGLRRALLALFCSFCLHCGAAATLRQSTVTVLNIAAASTGAAAPRVLEAMCRDQLRAIHHTGELQAGHCVRTDTPRRATEDEVQALLQVRARWHQVRVDYAAFASAHDAARVVLESRVEDGVLVLPKLADLTAAYSALQHSAAALGVALPNTETR